MERLAQQQLPGGGARRSATGGEGSGSLGLGRPLSTTTRSTTTRSTTTGSTTAAALGLG